MTIEERVAEARRLHVPDTAIALALGITVPQLLARFPREKHGSGLLLVLLFLLLVSTE